MHGRSIGIVFLVFILRTFLYTDIFVLPKKEPIRRTSNVTGVAFLRKVNGCCSERGQIWSYWH
jgi:hypothetical protein